MVMVAIEFYTLIIRLFRYSGYNIKIRMRLYYVQREIDFRT